MKFVSFGSGEYCDVNDKSIWKSLPGVGVRVGDGFKMGRGPGMVVGVGEYWVELEKVDGAFERSGKH